MKNEKNPSSDMFDPVPALSQNMSKPVAWKAPYLHLPITRLAQAFLIGDIINEQYEVKKICHGSMGMVFKCYDRVARVDVAIKTLIDERKFERERVYAFYEEVQLRVQLEPHRNVVRFRLVEQINGYPYIVSEWIEGHECRGNSLESWMESCQFTLEEIVDFMQQICAGLRHCSKHLSTENKPFVLGDLKPENILVTKEQVFKLADFSTHSYTKGWESPEQRQNKPLDERSDIYTLGLIAIKLFGRAEQPEEKELLACKLKELTASCVKADLQDRMPSLAALEAALNMLCEEFGLPYYQGKAAVPHISFLDSIYKMHSEINLGMRLTSTASLSDQSWVISKGMFQGGVEEYAEYVRIPDRYTYEAESALRQGDPEKALKILSQNESFGSKKTPRHLYIRGLTYFYKNDFVRAITDFDAASAKELYLPALDAKADILLQNPALLNEQTRFDDVKVTLERFFAAFSNDSNGFLSNQIYGKYLMLRGEYAFASRAFQESLFYPNAAEWNNLYYYGVCEYRQRNVYKAITIFLSTVQVIESDSNYITDYKKAVTLMFCLHILAKEKETERVVMEIRRKYNLEFQNLLDSLHHDHQVHQKYWEDIQSAEAQYSGNTAALQSCLHALLDSLEQERPIENFFLMGDLVRTICSREVALLFGRQQYKESIAVCDKALSYDCCHPTMLRNKGACYLMDENYDLADACYRLALFYEQDPQIRQEIQGILDRIHEKNDEFPPPDN